MLCYITYDKIRTTFLMLALESILPSVVFAFSNDVSSIITKAKASLLKTMSNSNQSGKDKYKFSLMSNTKS